MRLMTKFLLEEKMIKRIFFLSVILFFGWNLSAKEIPAKPNRLVNDYAGILSAEQLQSLENLYRKYEDSTSSQFVIVIEESLDGESKTDRSMAIAESWGIGQKGKDNGMLIYLAIKERQYFWQTGYGLESRLNAGVVGEMFRRDFVPEAKGGNYYQGLYDVSISLMEKASGLYMQDHKNEKKKSPMTGIIIGLIIQ